MSDQTITVQRYLCGVVDWETPGPQRGMKKAENGEYVLFKDMQEAVQAERQRCLLDTCRFCDGKEATFMSVDYEPTRNKNGVWWHMSTQPLAENLYCDAGKTHERVYQERLKERG